MYPIDCKAVITKHPNVPLFDTGDIVTLKCTVKNADRAIKRELTYQWFREGSDGEELKLEKTGKAIKLSPLTTKDAGRYRCVVVCGKLGEWKIKSNELVMNVKGEISA